MMRMLPQEELLASVRGTNYEVALTNWRVVSRGESLGATVEQIIPLESVDSVFVGTSRYNLLLYLGIATLIGGLAVSSMGVLVVAALLCALWWLLAKRGAQIISRSGKAVIVLQGTGGVGEAVSQVVSAMQETLRKMKDGAHSVGEAGE